ncbi:MAG: gliding motility-associated-like protein [Vicingaceae bacterium]|jgi:gliding motility-associated-like protein
MKFFNYLTLLSLLFISGFSFAQAPNWSVDPNQFQYSMTATAVLDLNCAELTNPSNQLGAFVGNTLRGTAFTSTVIGGRYEASMTIYSDLVNGENVTFHFYQNSSNTTFTSIDSIAFQDNAIFGSPASPLVIKTNNAPTLLTINSDTLNENASSGTVVGTFSTTDQNIGQTFTYSLVSGSGSTNNSLFSISGADLVANFSANFESKSSYAVRVKTTDSDGCFLEAPITVIIKDLNDAPTALLLNVTQIDENQFSNTTIGALSSTDPDANEVFTYSLVSGAGGSDNTSFNINGTNLRSSAIFDFETKSLYNVRLQVADKFNNTFVDTFKITVNNINDAPTDIVLTKDSVNENAPKNTIVATLSTIDQDAGQSFGYSFDNVPGNDNAQFNIVGNTLRTKEVFDFEVNNLYFIYIETNDLNGGTYTKQISINVADVNDAPTDIQLSTLSANENMPIGTFVAKMISTDQDVNSTFNYFLVNGVGNADNGNFQIRNDSLFTAIVLNLNNQATHDIRVQTDDKNGGTFAEPFTVIVKDINDVPTNITLSNNVIPENQAQGTEVGSFTSTDPDAGDIHTYSLVAGTGDADNISFSISSDKLLTNTTFNVNTKSTYSVRVQSNDGFGGVFQKVFTINIINSNDAPTNITITNDSVFESLPPNTFVGDFSTTDPDVSDTHTYNFVTGTNDNASFAIVSNQLRTTTSFNFEVKSNYFILVETNDGKGGTFSKQFNISIKDTTDGPTDIAINNNLIAENSPAQSFIGIFSSTDEDAVDSFTYSLTVGLNSTDNASFQISNDSLFTVSVFDYESRTSYSIRVRSTDASNLYTEKVFAVNVIDANDAPTDISLSNSIISEDAPLNTTVGVFATVDPDAGNTHSYSIVAGIGSTDNDDFKIVGNALKTDTVFDFNRKSTYSIRVKSADAVGDFFEKIITLNITDANDAPTDILISSDSIFENLIANTTIGTLSTTDTDVSDSHTYSLVSGAADNNSFAIVGSQLRSTQRFNFETKSSYFISIQTNDNNGGIFTKQLNVSIKDANDAPTNITVNDTTVQENMPLATFISSLNSTDEDASDTYSYTLVAGISSTNNASFLIRNDSLFSAVSFDFEVKNLYSIRIRTTDNSNSFTEKGFKIKVINGNDSPTDLNLSNLLIAENTPRNTTVGVFSSTDPDATDTYSYSLVGGSGSADNTSFSISGNELKTDTTFNVNVKSSYSIRVRTTDFGGLTAEKQLTIAITNSNDAPTDIQISNDSIFENLPTNTLIGDFTTTDPDAGDSHSYSLASGQNDNSSFTINGNQLRTTQVLDFETKNNYFISVQTDDGNGGIFIKQFTLFVKDAADRPTNVTLNNTSVVENQPTGTFIGLFSTEDADVTDNFSYSLVSGSNSSDNGSFQISTDSLFTNTTFNFELRRNYSIRVRTTDLANLTVERFFQIAIANGNDTPININLDNRIIGENVAINSLVGNLSTIDPDTVDAHTYSLVAGAGDADNDDFTIVGNSIRTDTVFDVNRKSSYAIRVQTTDGFGAIYEKVFTVLIVNVNDAPTDIALSPDDINENLPANTSVGNFSTVDVDLNDSFTYSFANLSSNDNASFAIVGNELRTSSVFDFEAKAVYFIQVQSTDAAGLFYSRQLFINVNDTNDTPTDMILSANSIREKQAVGEFLGRMNTVDQDAVDSYSYSLVNGTGADDNSGFIVRNDSVFSNTSFDVLIKTQLSIRIRTTDSENKFFEKVFTLFVQNVNDAPTDIAIDNASAPENTAINSTIGNFTTADIDPMQTFTYQLAAGTGDADNGNFIITGSQLKSSVLLDYNNKRRHNIRIKSTDQGGLITEKTFTINVTNSNDAPTDIALTPNNFQENLPQSSLIGLLSTVDKDSTDSFSYSFVTAGASDNASFIISGNELRTGVNFDFETKNLFVIQVQTTDNAGSIFSRQLTVNVTDSNDAPTALFISTDSLLEKLAKGTFVADLTTTDTDATDNFTYTFVAGQGGADNALFRINGNLLETDSSLNYNNGKNRTVRIQSSDKGGRIIQSAFVIRIINQNDLPTNILLSGTTVNEIAPIGTRVALVTSIDEDVADTFTYALVAGAGDAGNINFSIDGDQLNTNSAFDFETQQSYSIRISTIDNQGGSFEKTFTIDLTNGNEKPTIETQFFSTNENTAPNTTIGTVVASDMDAMETFSYKILGNQIDFRIVASSGELTSSRTFDYENNTGYEITIEVSDAGGLTDTATMTIEILDQIEGTLPASNYFSPNGDGRNDEWKIQNVELYSDFSLKIFSVNGEVVHEEASNYSNDWRGTLNGTQLPEGIYYYYFENTTNPSENFKGVITLKR